MAAGSSSSSIVPDSDPREYHPPPPHKFEPVGLKLYKPKRNTFDSGLVLREEVPQLPEQVIYFSRRGQWRSDAIPSPDDVELAVPPSVQQVSREYVEECFGYISGLRVLVRQKSMMIEDLEARLSVTQDQRVASAGHSASAPQGERASTMGRGSGDDDRDEEDNEEEEEDDEEDNVGSEDEEEGEEESEEEDRELASREASPSGPSSKKPRW